MTKFFKRLCFILAIIIMPFAFVACDKTPETPAVPAGSGGGTTGGSGGTETPPTEVVFELNQTTANEILSNSIVVFENAVETLNESDILNLENEKSYEVISSGLFGYMYNANEFKKALGATPVNLGGVYAYRLGGITNSNYFQMFNSGNDKLYVNYLLVESEDYQYIGYEIILDNGEIQEINLNYFETKKDWSSTLFYNGKFDIKNSTFEVASGKVFEYTRTYLESKFTTENVDSVSWAYTYYDKFVFGENEVYEHNYDNAESLEYVNSNIEEFEVLKVFELYDAYTELEETEIYRILTNETNYIGNIKASGGVSYVYRDNKIEKNI